MAYTTVNKSGDYFNTKLYAGTGSSNSVTGVGFQPDFTWIKQRNGLSENHALFDVVRGVTKYVKSDETASEVTEASSLSAFGTDGFTVVSSGKTNTSGRNYASWNWKAGGSASTNNDGSTACSLSANATAGFSVSTHTVPSGNYTIGHGLGKKPKLVITKHTSTTGNFQTYFEGIGTENQQYLQLNTEAALANHSGLWGTGMTTSVVGLSNTALSAGTTAVTYSFAEIPGYSHFGTYTGNGNANGPFIYTGFKPAFIITKIYSHTDGWSITDSVRDLAVAPNGARNIANDSQAEQTNETWALMEKYSNGFKIKGTDNVTNADGRTYIYIAIGQSIVGTNNTPATAR
jgi:hypothetical protein